MPQRHAGVDRGAADSTTGGAFAAGPDRDLANFRCGALRRASGASSSRALCPQPSGRGVHFQVPGPQRAMAAKKATKKPNPALMKPVQPDDVLAAIVGNKPMPRSEITKKLWDYIKKHGLQDQKVKTNINADDALKAVFGGKAKVTMFEMTKLVSAHIKG
jgi:chromatin remodeling complex protein RSC6